jgi:hypothetical protein
MQRLCLVCPPTYGISSQRFDLISQYGGARRAIVKAALPS